MLSKINKERACRANHVLHFYIAEERGESFCSDQTEYDMADLLADFRHYCDVQGVDFNEVLERANKHYEAEQSE